VIVAATLLLFGCSSTHFAGKLESEGVTYLSTRKVIIRGKEAGFGSNVHVESTDQWVIQKIWDLIHDSRPYREWAASGYREIDLFINEGDKSPKVTLEVNVTDETHIKGYTAENGYRCPGLDESIGGLLKAEYERGGR